MRLWKRLWCWLAGHDWVQLLNDPHAQTVKSQFHTMAGCMGYCARCGFLWDDLPALARTREPELNTGDPYRTPAPMPACKCFVDKRGEQRIHPDCPRHTETERSQKPRRRVNRPVMDTRDFTFKRVVVVRNGKVVKDESSGGFAGFDRTMKSFEKTMEEFGKTMDRMGEDLDRVFDDKDKN